MLCKMNQCFLAAVAFAAICHSTESSLFAQYGTSFSYHNPRTGVTYSQNVYTGDHAAYGGFSYSKNGRTYSAGSGYSGSNFVQHQYHSTPKHSYGQGAVYGRGYHYGQMHYSR